MELFKRVMSSDQNAMNLSLNYGSLHAELKVNIGVAEANIDGLNKEELIAEVLHNNFVKYESLSDNEKQNIKDNLYNNEDIRNKLALEMEDEYNKIINSTINDIKAGKGVTNVAIRKEIDKILTEYVDRYVKRDESINPSISNVIETILIEEIRTIILCGTLVYELVGPAVAKICLKKAGEIKES